MLRPTPSPPLPKRPRLGSVAKQAAGASSTTSSEARQFPSEASEPSSLPGQVIEAVQQSSAKEAASGSDQTRSGNFAGDSILRHFTSVRDLTSALDVGILEVLASGVLSLLSSHSGGIIRAAARTNTYIAAERIVLEAMDPRRTDIRREILAFIEVRPELHSCLRNPPQLIQGDPSSNSPSRRTRSSRPASFALRKILRDELQPVDDNLHSDILDGCLPDTRVQVLEDLTAAIEEAFSSEGTQLVWLKGLVGAGKTAVISTTANKLVKRFRTAQFYCSRAETARSDARRILPTIACSLGTAESTIGQRLQKAIQSRPTKVTAPSEQLNLFIGGPLEGANGPTLIFVDGLDECANDDALDQFLAAIAGRAESVPPAIVFIVSSRPEQGISAKLGGFSHAIDLDDARYRKQTQADTRLYIRDRLPEHKLRDTLAAFEPPIVYEAAINKLAEVASGHFVVAAFTCSAILESDGDTTFASITLRLGRVSVDTVPLYDQFRTALRAIFARSRWRNSRLRKDLRSVLATVCCAQEPLPSTVIAHLCDVALGSAEAILRALAPLLVHPSDRYTFFHASVADFLESEDAGEYQISTLKHHSQLFSSCQTILRAQLDFNIFRVSNITIDLDQLDLQAVSPELAYASVFWTHHLAASSLRPEVAASEVATLLQSKLLFWLEVLSGLRRVYSDGVGGLNQVSTFLGASGGSIVSDCQRCLNHWGSEIARQPCRIYLTVLPWLPPSFRKQLCSGNPWILSISPRVLVGAPSCWPDELSIWHLGLVVNSVAWSPHGRLIAVVGDDGTVEIRNSQTGEQHRRLLRGHSGAVTSVAFNRDSSLIALGSEDRTIRLWDVDLGALHGKPLEGHASAVTSVAFSPDGSMLASGSWDDTIRLWNIPSGAPRGEPLRGHSDSVVSVAFSPDGSRIASGSRDHTVRLWDTRSGALCGEPLKGHTELVVSVAFSTDGSTVVSGSYDRTIRLWGVHSGAPYGKLLEGHTSSISSVAFSHGNSRFASGSYDHTIRLWDTRSGEPHGEPLKGHTGPVSSIAFSPDGSRIVSGSRDKTVRLWETHTRAPDGESLEGHTRRVFSIAFNPDGSRFASGSADNTVRLWDAISGRPYCGPLEGHLDSVRAVAFSSDGSTIASGSNDRTVRLWDAHSGAPRGTGLEGHTKSVLSVAFSPDSSRIASGSSDGTVQLWDANSGVPCGVPFKGHTDEVYSVAFSPDGSTIASASDDKTIRLWDAITGVPFGNPLKGHAGLVWSIAFSPDGSTLASGSLDKTVCLWSVDTGGPHCEPMEGHADWVNSVAFREDGTLLFSVSWNEMLVWDLGGLAPTLCDAEPSPVPSSTRLTPTAPLALPSGYYPFAFSPASRTLAGCCGPNLSQVFALQLSSYDPWKTLCKAHAQSHHATT